MKVSGIFVAAALAAAPAGAADQVAPAEVIGDSADWISPDDYPPVLIAGYVEGVVKIRWKIDVEGRARECQVLQSSGVPLLDVTACTLIERRARYKPARDLRRDRPIATTDSRTVRWNVPRDPPGGTNPFQQMMRGVHPFSLMVEVDAGADGILRNCRLDAAGVPPMLDQMCANLTGQMLPIKDGRFADLVGKHVTVRASLTASPLPAVPSPAN